MKERYIYIGEEKVSITEEVYQAFKRPAWTERKRRQVRAKMERSLEADIESGNEQMSQEALVEEIVEDKLLLDFLYTALEQLTADERGLINDLFFKDKSERKIAAESGVP